MRDRTTIHREIDQAQGHLAATLSALRAAVRHEIDPKLNVHRAVELGERKLREVALHAWAELTDLVQELRHTAAHEGWRAALADVVDHLRAALHDLRRG